jgi:hypothetical protein
MENEIEESVSVWNKTADELTVGESVKVIGVVTVMTVVTPIAILLAAGGVANLIEKRKARKALKLRQKFEVVSIYN